jgi:hypothetical protein
MIKAEACQLVIKNPCPNPVTESPAWTIIELPKKEWLTTLILNNVIPDESAGWTGISAKDVRIETSTTSSTSGFKTVASFQLELNKNNQPVHIDPVLKQITDFSNENPGVKLIIEGIPTISAAIKPTNCCPKTVPNLWFPP